MKTETWISADEMPDRKATDDDVEKAIASINHATDYPTRTAQDLEIADLKSENNAAFERIYDLSLALFNIGYDPTEKRQSCRKCGGVMKRGIATGQTYVGHPDFPGETGLEAGCTVTHGGPGKVITVLKCQDCGWSVSD